MEAHTMAHKHDHSERLEFVRHELPAEEALCDLSDLFIAKIQKASKVHFGSDYHLDS